MPNFAEKVEVAVDALTANPQREVDENEFIEASRLVYDGVRDIRRAVLLNRVSKNIASLPQQLYWKYLNKPQLIYSTYCEKQWIIT